MNETVDCRQVCPQRAGKNKGVREGDTGSGEVSLPFLEGFFIEMEKMEIPDYREHPL